MAAHPRNNGPPTIFRDGRLKPGIYNIQNVLTQTYLDIDVPKRPVYYRPAQNLQEGNGLVRPFVL